jgi:Domain of unknown function (DUF4397)
MGKSIRSLMFCAGGLALACVFGCLVGCGASGVATVRTIQLSPGTASVDAFASDTLIASAVPYGSASTYAQISTGSHTVSISPAGQDKTTLFKQVVDFFNGTNSTVFVVNPATSLSEYVVTDDNDEPDSGDCTLRIVHASPSAGPVDVYIVPPGTDINGSGIVPQFQNMVYQSFNGYLELPGGSYQIIFTVAGNKAMILAHTPAVTYAIGDVSTVVLADAPTGGAPYQAYDYTDATWSNNAGQ